MKSDLISALLSLSTVRLPYGTLAVALQQLATYISRFRTRLSGIHLVHLKRLLVFLDALKQYVLEWKESKTVKSGGNDNNSGQRKIDSTEVMTISEFMERLGRKAGGINLLEIEQYLKTSKVVDQMNYQKIRLIIYTQVARKISGYAEKQAEKTGSSMAFLLGHKIELARC
jgi:chromosome transmission fidelity protein 1